MAGRVYVGDKEDPERERRHHSSSARSGGDPVVVTARWLCGEGCRAAVRVGLWTDGPVQTSTVSVTCTHGPDLDALAVSLDSIMMSVFTICRKFDAFVPGPRETGQHQA